MRVTILHDPLSREITHDLTGLADAPCVAAAVANPLVNAALPPDCKIRVVCNGQLVDNTEEAWLEDIPEGAHLIMGASAGIVVDWVAVALALLAVAASVASALLIDLPTDFDQPDEIGEDASPAYTFAGQRTNYRGGFPVPLLFGRVRVPCTAVSVGVDTADTRRQGVGPDEILSVVLALGEGPIHSIGGITQDESDLGVFDFEPTDPGQPQPGTIPAGVRVNGNLLDDTLVPARQNIPGGQPGQQWWRNTPNAKAWVRLGNVGQAPTPIGEATQTAVVNYDLDDQGASFVQAIADTDRIDYVRFIFSFAAGLYTSGPPQAPATVRLQLEWRPQGETAWRGSRQFTVTESLRAGFVATDRIRPNVPGPIEVRVRRTTAAGGAGVVDRCRWRQITYGFQQTFNYSRTALLALQLQASEVSAGSNAQYSVEAEGLLVHVWDANINSGNPSEPEHWEVPAGSYAGIWSYNAGENPAWCAARLFTHQAGLREDLIQNRESSITEIDWPAFRNWADYCDGSVQVNGVSEARHRISLVQDRAEKVGDILARMFSAGRAAPVIRGNKISVVYQYFASHGRGTNSVAQRFVSQLLTSANIQDFRIEYLDVRSRPGILAGQFANEATEYSQDTVPLRDPDGGFDDATAYHPIGYTQQPARMRGFPSEAQVLRELLFRHAANRLGTHRVGGRLPPQALIAQAGDLVQIAHPILRPWDVQAQECKVAADVVSSTTITFTRSITLGAGSYGVVLHFTDGTIATRVISSGAGTYAAGDPLTLATPVDVDKNSRAVVGVFAEIVETYELRSLSLNPGDNSVSLQAIVFPEAAHTLADADVGPRLRASGGVTDGIDSPTGGSSSWVDTNDDLSAVTVSELRASRIPGPGDPRYRVSWEKPTGRPQQSIVWFREQSSPSWQQAAAPTWDNHVETELLFPGTSYEVSVCLEDQHGRFQAPGAGSVLAFTAEEFASAAPPDVRNLKIHAGPLGPRLTWADHDPAYTQRFEVREVVPSAGWFGARMIAQTPPGRPEVELPFAGFPTSGNPDPVFEVRAIGHDGMPSPNPARVTWDSPAIPEGYTQTHEQDAFYTSKTTQVDTAGPDFTMPQSINDDGIGWHAVQWDIDCGYDAEAWVSLYAPVSAVCDATADDYPDMIVGDGESWWTFVEGRPASVLRPGLVAEDLTSDYDFPVDELPPGSRAGADAGEPGERVHVRLEYRHATDAEGSASAKDWETYTGPFRAVHRYLEIRIVIERLLTEPGVTVTLATPAVRRII